MILAILFALSISSPFIARAVGDDVRRCVVIDAGHGGEDSGVVGARTGVKESELNLRVARLLGEFFSAAGYRVVYTRTSDSMHSFQGVRNNKKRADMFKRGEIINSAKPDVVISVHMNFYSSAARRGAQTFFDRGNEESRALAEKIQSSLNERINLVGGGRQYSALSAEKYLLSCSPYPAVIVECGFLSNPIDEENLCRAEHQALVAEAIYLGTISYLDDLSNEQGDTL